MEEFFNINGWHRKLRKAGYIYRPHIQDYMRYVDDEGSRYHIRFSPYHRALSIHMDYLKGDHHIIATNRKILKREIRRIKAI